MKYSLVALKKNSDLASHKILDNLETIYQAAFEKGNFSCAIKAIELQGKELGLFNEKKKAPVLQQLFDMPLDDLEILAQTSRVDPSLETGMEKNVIERDNPRTILETIGS